MKKIKEPSGNRFKSAKFEVDRFYRLNRKTFGEWKVLCWKPGEKDFKKIRHYEAVVLLQKEDLVLIDVSPPFLGEFKVNTNEGLYQFKADEKGDIALSLLHAQAKTSKTRKDVRIDQCEFYFYEEDGMLDDPHDFYSFFIGKDNEIIIDELTFSDTYSDPLIIEEVFDLEIFSPISSKGAITALADTIWMYRKFYKETVPGQLMKIKEELIVGSPENASTAANPVPYLESIATWIKAATVLLGLVVLKLFIF